MPTRIDFTRYDTLDDLAYYNGDGGQLGQVIERARNDWSAYAEKHGLKDDDWGGQKAFLRQYVTPFVQYIEDKALLAAYQRTSGQADGDEANKLLAETEQRNLDV